MKISPLAVVALLTSLLTGCSTLGVKPALPPVRVPQIVQMSREGIPAQAIIRKMRASRTAYRLTAAQLVQLHKEGVPDSVLNYMQGTYLQAVRHNQRLEDWNRWNFDGGWWYSPWPEPWGWGPY